MRTLGLCVLSLSSLILLPACPGGGSSDDGPMPPATGVFDTGMETTSGGTTDGPDETTGVDPDSTGSSGTATGAMTCEEADVSISGSTQPAGVIFMIDNSPSMGEEAAEISARLNGFADTLSAQIDASYVMISAYPADDPQGVCVGPPLGNGGCPASDNNPPEYIHIDLPVTPLNAISHIFVTYEQWADALPADAKRHLVVVSDGDTGVNPLDFDLSFLMLDPELNADYRFHVSVATSDCEQATTVGNNYMALADASHGFVHDLCTQNYETFTQGLLGSILNDTGNRCRYELPPTPEGSVFHPDYVQLLLNLDGVMTSPPQVPSELDCPIGVPSWYWENPVVPQVMLACPDTCNILDDYAVVESSVRFQCPPEGADESTG